MSVGPFQNGRKVEHFNEPLSQRSAYSLIVVVIMVECFINGEESSAEKKDYDVKEHVPNAKGSQHTHTKEHIHLSDPEQSDV